MTVIDVSEADFEREVIDRSRTVPVIVDFWAAWCGPCRALGPLLEDAAQKRPGKVVLAKIDTDANPGVSQRYAIQSIPAVKAFRDGDVVDEFVGAQGPAAVERFFDKLVPSEADELIAAGDEASLRAALALDHNRPDAALALARVLLARGARDEALALIEPVVGNFQAEGLAARLRLERRDAHAEAFDALDAGQLELALDMLIDALPQASDAQHELRRVVVGELDRLGAADPLTRDVRRRLAAALY